MEICPCIPVCLVVYVCVCVFVCVHASATEKETETERERERKREREKTKQPMRRKESLVPHHGLVSLSNLWQSARSQGLKDRRCWRKGKLGPRKRSILHRETRSVGYLLSIDLMTLEKHLALLLNAGWNSAAEGLFRLPLPLFFDTPFFVTQGQRRKEKSRKKVPNKHRDL